MHAYIALMLRVVAFAMAASSRLDPVLRQELAGLPEGFELEMRVLPKGPQMRLRADRAGRFSWAPNSRKAKPDLSIRFKHLAHAFLVLSFQEGTAQAFAHNRMVADGDLAVATRMVRCLDRMECLILPAFVARRAVKRYPSGLRLPEKLGLALRIYAVAGALSLQALLKR